MRETLDFLMQRAGEDAGLSSAETAAILQPDAQYPYDLGNGVLASRTVHRGVDNGFGEYLSQGGCRVEVYEDGEHPDLASAVDHSGALAANQTLKNILGGLPMGGAKADIFVPRSVFQDPNAFHAALGTFVRGHAKVIRHGDGIGPDMNLVAEDMDFMADTLVGLSHDPRDLARFTGKSIGHGGVPGREDATSHGMLTALKLFLQAEGRDIEGISLAIEGSGNVGYHFARLAHAAGAYILGMSDIERAVVAHNLHGSGLIPDKDIRFNGRSIESFDPERAHASERPEDLHWLDADVFVFAGPSNSESVRRRNIGSVVARRQLFGANTPKDQEAIEFAEHHGIVIYPDAGVNFGGVVGSYVERTSFGRATQAEVYGEIDTRITQAVGMLLHATTNPTRYLREANRIAVQQLYGRDHQLPHAA